MQLFLVTMVTIKYILMISCFSQKGEILFKLFFRKLPIIIMYNILNTHHLYSIFIRFIRYLQTVEHSLCPIIVILLYFKNKRYTSSYNKYYALVRCRKILIMTIQVYCRQQCEQKNKITSEYKHTVKCALR